MNNLTNKLFTNVANFAETPGVIANAADKLLSRILLEENVAAAKVYYHCKPCFLGIKWCKRCVDVPGADVCTIWQWYRC